LDLLWRNDITRSQPIWQEAGSRLGDKEGIDTNVVTSGKSTLPGMFHSAREERAKKRTGADKVKQAGKKSRIKRNKAFFPEEVEP